MLSITLANYTARRTVARYSIQFNLINLIAY